MSQPADFIRRLVTSRYKPLAAFEALPASDLGGVLSSGAREEADAAIAAVIPLFEDLRDALHRSDSRGAEAQGVIELVASHLLELWILNLVRDPNMIGTILHNCSRTATT